jgi:hypothetical protein
MDVPETTEPLKTRRSWRWLPDRFELFEVAVLFIASHFIAIGTLIFEWGSGGFLSGIAWVLGIFFFYWFFWDSGFCQS